MPCVPSDDKRITQEEFDRRFPIRLTQRMRTWAGPSTRPEPHSPTGKQIASEDLQQRLQSEVAETDPQPEIEPIPSSDSKAPHSDVLSGENIERSDDPSRVSPSKSPNGSNTPQQDLAITSPNLSSFELEEELDIPNEVEEPVIGGEANEGGISNDIDDIYD